MSAGSEQRKLAAIMFTDMVGYSALSQRDAGLPVLRTDTLLPNLHDDPRWDAFLHTMGLANDQLK